MYKYIIYEPYEGTNAYLENMKRCWENKYKVIPHASAEDNLYVLLCTKAIVLNWIESNLDKKKKKQLLLYKLLGIKIVWVFHNRIPHEFVDSGQQAKTAKKNMRFMAGISDAIILHSRNSRKYLLECTNNSKKFFYVPHPYYLRQSWGGGDVQNEDDCFTFVFQGAVLPYKNIELLIKVFKDLKLPDCKLHIAGKAYDEMYEKKIRELCQGANICLTLEYLSDSAVGEVIRKANVMVLPYDLRSSMNSGAMLNAFSNHRTVIVSNNAMAQDYKEKDFLYIYDYSSQQEHYEQLKKTMKVAYENGIAANRKMGENAYEYTRKYNGDKAVIHKLEKVIEAI